MGVEEDIVRLEQLDPLTTPSKVLLQSPSRPLPTQPTSAGNAPPTTPTRAVQAAPSSPVPKQARVSIAAPKEPARAGMKPSQASRASSANNRNLRETILNSANMHDDEALSKEMKRIRESTYRRPVSIFGKFSVNADYDVVLRTTKSKIPMLCLPRIALNMNRTDDGNSGRWTITLLALPFLVVRRSTSQLSLLTLISRRRNALLCLIFNSVCTYNSYFCHIYSIQKNS